MDIGPREKAKKIVKYHFLCKRLGYYFNNIDSLDSALKNKPLRLIYIGDSVLALIVTKLILDRKLCNNLAEFNNLKECYLGSDFLAQIAKNLRVGNGDYNLKTVLGAIYLDSGYEYKIIVRIVSKLFSPYLEKNKVNSTSQDEVKQDTSASAYTVVSRKRQSKDNYFNQGAYEFRQIVFNWRVATIEEPLSKVQASDELPADFTKTKNYPTVFKPLILEEARATLEVGFKALEYSQENEYTYTLVEFKLAKNAHNPSLLTLSGALPEASEYGVTNIALLLKPIVDMNSLGLRKRTFLGLASFNQQQTGPQKKLYTRVIIPESYKKLFKKSQNKTHLQWRAAFLGGLAPHVRMYEACHGPIKIAFKDQLITGKIPALPVVNLETITEPYIKKLNQSQQTAIARFVKLDKGLQVLQGPPGTGKTTTIVALLRVLAQQDKRVLVCAASNKGVQVLAQRFIKKAPDISAVLVGVKQKLTADLLPVYLQAWGDEICQQLSRRQPEFIQDKAKLLALAEKIRNYVPSLYDHDAWDEIKKLDPTDESAKAIIIASLEQQKRILIQANQASEPNQPSRLERLLLNNVNIVFATLSSSGRRIIKEAKQFNVVIIDEAGQAVEPESLIALRANPEKCLLVGDTMQLPATVLSPAAIEKNFGCSLMSRLVEDNEQACGSLTTQYRMNSVIRQWPSDQYYQGQLEDDEKADSSSPMDLPAVLAPCSFINVLGQESKKNYSYENFEEAALTINILYYLRARGVDLAKQVMIISFYSGQVALLNKLIAKNPKLAGVKVCTVDSSQGDESDYVIVSFVRANPNNKVGFLRDFRRLNVAITRARFMLTMLGNAEVLLANEIDVGALIINMRMRHLFFSVEQLKDELQSVIQQAKQAEFERNNKFSELESKLGYGFSDKQLIQTALIHQSAMDEKQVEPDPLHFRYRMLGRLALCLALVVKSPGGVQLGQGLKSNMQKDKISGIGYKLLLQNLIVSGSNKEKAPQEQIMHSVLALLGAILIDCNQIGPVQRVINKLWFHDKLATKVSARPSNYKTVQCRFFNSSRGCRKGNSCNYAHGPKELRNPYDI